MPHQPLRPAPSSGVTHADKPHAISSALRAATPPTLPILAGFVFLGITCGVYSVSLGLPWWTPTLMACLIFAGSAEFVVASMLVGPFAPLQAFVTVFIVNARHLFYGLSMLERFRGLGRKRPYLIFAQCDETFSINYSTRPPAGVDEGWFMFFVSLLNQLYWVVGCTLGGVLGSVAALNVAGVDFAMTALFVVIFLDQWTKDPSHASAVVGILASLVALALFGPDGFMIPALALILAAITVLRSHLEPIYNACESRPVASTSDTCENGPAASTPDAAGTHHGGGAR